MLPLDPLKSFLSSLLSVVSFPPTSPHPCRFWNCIPEFWKPGGNLSPNPLIPFYTAPLACTTAKYSHIFLALPSFAPVSMLSDNTFASNLNAVCRAGGFNFVPEGTECRNYQHSFYVLHKFYYFKSGNCKITIQGKEYEGIPNRWFFIPAMVPHSYGNYDLQHYADYWLHFDLQPDGIQAFDEHLPYYVDVPNNSRVDKIFKTLLRAEKSNKAADVFKAKAALMELIGEYIHLASPDLCVSESKDPDIQRITEYITANMDKNITVEELAHLCHLHPTHFIRAFKNKAGETPGRQLS